MTPIPISSAIRGEAQLVSTMIGLPAGGGTVLGNGIGVSGAARIAMPGLGESIAFALGARPQRAGAAGPLEACAPAGSVLVSMACATVLDAQQG